MSAFERIAAARKLGFRESLRGCKRPNSGQSAARFFLLNGRTGNVTERAVYAAVPILRAQHGFTVRTLVVELTGVGRHLFL